MAIALLMIGIVMVIAAVRNTQGALFSLLQGDFTGTNNFIYWVVAILVIGAIGNVKQLKGFSNAFLALVIIVILLTHKGFFGQLQSALASTGATSTATNTGLSGII